LRERLAANGWVKVNAMSMQPLATYQAVWFDSRHTFELYPDAVRVVGVTFFQSSVDATVPLATLQPRVDRVWRRSGAFLGGIYLLAFGLVGYGTLVEGFHMDSFGRAPGAIGVSALAGIIMALATARKTEFAQFVSDAGVPELTIARSGKTPDEFEEFVGLILTQIRKVKGLA
jgi:hypothetical protein